MSILKRGYNRLASSTFFDNLNPQLIYDKEKKPLHKSGIQP